MTVLTVLQLIVNVIIVVFLIGGLVLGAVLLFKDKRQKQHSVPEELYAAWSFFVLLGFR